MTKRMRMNKAKVNIWNAKGKICVFDRMEWNTKQQIKQVTRVHFRLVHAGSAHVFRCWALSRRNRISYMNDSAMTMSNCALSESPKQGKHRIKEQGSAAFPAIAGSETHIVFEKMHFWDEHLKQQTNLREFGFVLCIWLLRFNDFSPRGCGVLHASWTARRATKMHLSNY